MMKNDTTKKFWNCTINHKKRYLSTKFKEDKIIVILLKKKLKMCEKCFKSRNREDIIREIRYLEIDKDYFLTIIFNNLILIYSFYEIRTKLNIVKKFIWIVYNLVFL